MVLKKFGLLDRDFHLRPFMISLLTEQVAGFYDNKTKTVNLLDWIRPEEQKPVLAHELTHALQDQKVDLTKWSEVGREGHREERAGGQPAHLRPTRRTRRATRWRRGRRWWCFWTTRCSPRARRWRMLRSWWTS